MATIFCFSSTGNSLYLAKELASKLDATILPMTTSQRECHDAIIGFIFPTYYLGLPRTVTEFISSLHITSKNPYLFAITTYGGNSFGLGAEVNRLLAPQGLALNYFNKVRAVENYIPSSILFVDNWSFIHHAMDKKRLRIAEDLLNQKEKRFSLHTPINTLFQQFYPASHQEAFDCNFSITNCVGCGLCEKVCPINNIHLVDQKPTFSGNCTLCLACFHACPQEAINWKHSKGKKRYRHPNISTAELIHFYHNPSTNPVPRRNMD